MIVPEQYFLWFISTMVAGLAVGWMIVDIVRLRRALAEGKDAHDRIFGSIMGLVMAILGLIGVLKHHLHF
jgi:hypothetical protein